MQHTMCATRALTFTTLKVRAVLLHDTIESNVMSAQKMVMAVQCNQKQTQHPKQKQTQQKQTQHPCPAGLETRGAVVMTDERWPKGCRFDSEPKQ
jgi:hypothetical protein